MIWLQMVKAFRLKKLSKHCNSSYGAWERYPHSNPVKRNLMAPELFFLILAHSVYKMWIIQEPNTLELWNKLHFEEKKTESIYHV